MALLRADSISKSFGGVAALADVSFELRAGEITGLIGENGAGKSTLIKILSGVHHPDGGTVFLNGKPAVFSTPNHALQAGIATIHQELACFETLTVAENLMLHESWPRQFWGGTDWRRLNGEAAARLAKCDLALEPEMLFQKLSPAQRQEIAIARALSTRAQVLILDEPTASLTEPEVARLISHLKRFRDAGVAVLYVSHRLDEILELTDSIVVLRDGRKAGEYPAKEATIERMVRDMVGRELSANARRRGAEAGPVIFSAAQIQREPLFRSISFSVRAGEIVGLAGLVGAGRSEIARAIYGLYPLEAGSMTLGGESFAPGDPAEARRRGVVYVPEERKRQGFALGHSLRSSISIGFLERISRFGSVSHRVETEAVSRAVERFRIKTRGLEQAVGTLSGGNQQKALLARSLESDPSLIILDEPTRGVDVGAKAEIHKLIDGLAREGKAVILISSDLPEILSLSDRILVMHRGELAAEFPAGASQESILFAASGLH